MILNHVLHIRGVKSITAHRAQPVHLALMFRIELRWQGQVLRLAQLHEILVGLSMISDHTLSELLDLRRGSFLQGELPHLNLSQSSMSRFCCKGLVSAGHGSQRRYCTEQSNNRDCGNDHSHKRKL